MSEDIADLAPDSGMQQDFQLRDDNLRLLFSEAAKRDLSERLRAIEAGFVILAVSVLIAITGWFFHLISTEPRSDVSLAELLLPFDGIQNFLSSALLLIAAIVTILSPVILFMLVIERRRCRREMKDLIALLRRYGRE